MDRRDFELLRDEEIPELNTRALLYRHRTGCEIVSLINDDENKVFGINFRTPPADSTGIAHILEHSVLCGSRKYPVKEPFVELIKGSLNTFLNAFTYPDKTCYPVASTNLQDFYNLIDVYLDAVFYPRLTPEVLQQEGWHYEIADPGDPLRYKGVVFNEMKGAYSDPERILASAPNNPFSPTPPTAWIPAATRATSRPSALTSSSASTTTFTTRPMPASTSTATTTPSSASRFCTTI